MAFSPIVCGAESHDHVERFVQVREVQNTPTVLEQEKPMSTWSFPPTHHLSKPFTFLRKPLCASAILRAAPTLGIKLTTTSMIALEGNAVNSAKLVVLMTNRAVGSDQE